MVHWYSRQYLSFQETDLTFFVRRYFEDRLQEVERGRETVNVAASSSASSGSGSDENKLNFVALRG